MNKAAILRLSAYLEHMLEAIERCREYVENMDEEAFLRDRKTQDAVIRSLEVLGEASNNIRKHYPEFVQAHPELPFGFAVGMRNALSHGYFTVDLNIVWKTIHAELPPLQQMLRGLRDSLSHP
jgi:uncharacterized protein with HEPN domain